MKKILILFLVLTLGLALVACGGGDDPCTEHVDADSNGKCDKCDAAVEPDDGGDEGNGDTGSDLVLVTDSKTKFAVVTANSLSDSAEKYVTDFVKELNKYYLDGQDLAQNYDAPGFDDAVEIIFGSTDNRGDAFKKDEHYLGYKGFSVEVVGNKLFVLAGGDKGYQSAIKYLEDTLFGLESYGEDVIDELVIPANTKYEEIPTDYSITEFTIDGKAAKDFVLAYDSTSKPAKNAALILQEAIYKDAGIWLPYVALNKVTDEQKAVYVEFTKGDAERTTDNGCIVYVKDGDLHIECEFENKFEQVIYNFIDAKITKGKVKLASDYTYTEDVRNIYYKDFGAVGDGRTDDFFALKECHDYANKYGHTVNGDPEATYYIGKANGKESIIVKTDTYFNLCSFIFDDREVDLPSESSAFRVSIFEIKPSKDPYTISGASLPVTSVPSGSTSIGDWAPGERVLVKLYDESKRQYIRFGNNQNNGDPQLEVVIVNADGTIDPTTPVQWDYTTLSKMIVYPIDETPITVSGGTRNQVDNYAAMGKFDNFDAVERATVYTYFNEAPSEYTYYLRNFNITRSNVTIKNIQHVLYDDVETSAPYHGFIAALNATDITVEGMIFEKQKSFSTIGAGGTAHMGSYEIQAEYSANVTWRHSRQSNFFEPDGSVQSRGYMNTDYCRNLRFEDMLSCSFDAHRNLYNATLVDVVAEHLNFIGGGTVRIENVTVYTDGNAAGIVLRQDYGATWCGDVIINGMTLRSSYESDRISLIKAIYNNHNFGYTCYLPRKLEINNVKLVQYDYKMENGVRTEWDVATNSVPLSLYKTLEGYANTDISNPNADMTSLPNDWKKCNCEEVYGGTKSFNDTDGDGRCNNDLDPNDSYSVWCWGFEEKPDNSKNTNPYIPTEEIYITGCGDLQFVLPSTPQFEDTKLYIDGELQK